jgi:phosphatidate cytidylyltransferase
MLRQRLLTVVVLMPIIAVLLILGGWPYAFGVALTLAIGGIEFVSLMRKGNYRPYGLILVAAIVLMVLVQETGEMGRALGPGLAAFLIISMTAMLAAYGQGDQIPVVNFGLTVGGALYIGWLGAHFVALRKLPDGLYWSLVVVPAIGAADSSAYVIGRWRGRHKMAPLVSPGKTWEGYLGGALGAAIFGAFAAALASILTPHIRPLDGALIGLLVGLISPVGDLGMSTVKRMVGAKDASNILPGHGGVLDRIDSALVGATIGFYYIAWIVLPRLGV